MSRAEVLKRLRADGWSVSYDSLNRLSGYALDEPSWGRPAGKPGHRRYSESDYRKMVAWLRVHQLTGNDSEPEGTELRRKAVEVLADATFGYVWISGEAVGWSALPPVGVLRNGGVMTCWPAGE